MVSVVTSFMNRKGGCSKSSCTLHLGGELARQGRRVLLLDLDPQTNLSQALFGEIVVAAMPPSATVLALFNDELPEPEPARLIIPSGVASLDILPGADDLKRFDHPSPETLGPLGAVVRQFVCEARRDYDMILIDCPPSVGLCSWNALNASDFVVVPVVPEGPCAQGIGKAQQFIDLILSRVNPQLKLLGYLLTQADMDEATHRGYIETARNLYGVDVFGAMMPAMASFATSWDARLPVSHFRPRSPAARAMHTIAEEMLQRIGRLQLQPARFLGKAMGA